MAHTFYLTPDGEPPTEGEWRIMVRKEVSGTPEGGAVIYNMPYPVNDPQRANQLLTEAQRCADEANVPAVYVVRK